MKLKRTSLTSAIALLVALSYYFSPAIAQNAEQAANQAVDQKAAAPQELPPSAMLPEGLYARLDTSQGKILIVLLEEQAPKTVENFVALAVGEKEFTEPKTGAKVKRHFYDDLIFHRVASGQYIQSGCLLGDGMGDPGFTIPDEIDPERQQTAGSLSMFRNINKENSANSQFILSCAPLDRLDGKLTIFGQTVYGLSVIESISRQKVGLRNKPLRTIKLKRMEIIKVTADEPLSVSQALNKGDRVILVQGDKLIDEEERRQQLEEMQRADEAATAFYYRSGRFTNVLWARDIMGTSQETLLDAQTWLALRKQMAEERDALIKKQEEEKKKKEKEKEKKIEK